MRVALSKRNEQRINVAVETFVYSDLVDVKRRSIQEAQIVVTMIVVVRGRNAPCPCISADARCCGCIKRRVKICKSPLKHDICHGLFLKLFFLPVTTAHAALRFFFARQPAHVWQQDIAVQGHRKLTQGCLCCARRSASLGCFETARKRRIKRHFIPILEHAT